MKTKMNSFRLLFGHRFSISLLVFWISILSISAQNKQVISPCSANDTLSSQVCSCRNSVVSCDFSKLPDVQNRRESTVEVNGRNIDTSVKRLCLCHSSKFARLSLPETFLPAINVIHRVDLYDIRGTLDVNKAFRIDFGGDLYVENVANWTRMRKFEFGRGVDFDIRNVPELTCCSKISTPKLEMPTLYMKNVNVTYIEHRGIDDMHGWKNVILDRLKVNGAAPSAIHYGISGLNISISILNSEFHNLTNNAILLRDVTNVILARSKFYPSCEASSFVARSKLAHSSLAIIQNIFSNAMNWQMDAQNIINWFNLYDFWHQTTFLDFNRSDHKARTISIEYNTVENFLLSERDTIRVLPGDSIHFNENILSNCNCIVTFPKLLQLYTNRCRSPISGSKSKTDVCAVDLQKVKRTCSSGSRADLQKLCQDKDFVYTTDSISSLPKVEFKAKTLSLMSPFIAQQLKYADVPIKNHELLRAKNHAENIPGRTFFIHLLPICVHLCFVYLYI